MAPSSEPPDSISQSSFSFEPVLKSIHVCREPQSNFTFMAIETCNTLRYPRAEILFNSQVKKRRWRSVLIGVRRAAESMGPSLLLHPLFNTLYFAYKMPLILLLLLPLHLQHHHTTSLIILHHFFTYDQFSLISINSPALLFLLFSTSSYLSLSPYYN